MAAQQPRLTLCKIPGCGEAYKIRRGLCPMHYARWRVHGDVNTVLRAKVGPGKCSITGCGRLHHAKGYCARHYRQSGPLNRKSPSTLQLISDTE